MNTAGNSCNNINFTPSDSDSLVCKGEQDCEDDFLSCCDESPESIQKDIKNSLQKNLALDVSPKTTNKIWDIVDTYFTPFLLFLYLNAVFIALYFCGIEVFATVPFALLIATIISSSLYEYYKNHGWNISPRIMDYFNSFTKASLPLFGIYYWLQAHYPMYHLTFFLVIIYVATALYTAQIIHNLMSSKFSRDTLVSEIFPLITLAIWLVLHKGWFSLSLYLELFAPNLNTFMRFIPYIFLGYFSVKQGKAMSGTFNLKSWPKFAFAFILQFMLMLADKFNFSNIELLFNILSLKYLVYTFVLIPLLFNQILSEEYICRTFILKTRGKLDAYNICYSVLAFVFLLYFVSMHRGYFQSGFMGLMECLANYLPMSMSWLGVALFSGSVEYSVGLHFANNLAILLFFDLPTSAGISSLVGAAGFTSSSWFPILAQFIIKMSLHGTALFTILFCEGYFKSREPLSATSDKVDGGASPLKSDSILDEKNNVMKNIADPKSQFDLKKIAGKDGFNEHKV